MHSSLRSLIIPAILILATLALISWVINPTRHQLPILRQAISANRGQLEAYAQSIIHKQKINEENSPAEIMDQLNQVAVPKGQELGLITALEQLSDKVNVTQHLRLDESKPAKTTNWQTSVLYLEAEGSFSKIIKYLREIEHLPYLISLNTLRIDQSAAPNVKLITAGQVFWSPAKK